jgi:hypothetical protein
MTFDFDHHNFKGRTTMTIIDVGNGQTVPRHHVPKAMAVAFDQASGALREAQANIRSWVRQVSPMQAPAGFSGDVICNSVGQTGRVYTLSEQGGALLVDPRDVPVFTGMGFTPVPSGPAPTTGLRPGLVFMDTSLNEYMRFDGSAWAPVTLS